MSVVGGRMSDKLHDQILAARTADRFRKVALQFSDL